MREMAPRLLAAAAAARRLNLPLLEGVACLEGGEREEEKGGDPKGPQPITSAAQYPRKRKKEKKKARNQSPNASSLPFKAKQAI